MTHPLKALREAAEKAVKVAPGQWERDTEKCDEGYHVPIAYDGAGKRLFDAHSSDIVEMHEDCGSDDVGDWHDRWDENSYRVLDFTVAANPQAILQLLDERDRLEAERDSWKQLAEARGSDRAGLFLECEQLRAHLRWAVSELEGWDEYQQRPERGEWGVECACCRREMFDAEDRGKLTAAREALSQPVGGREGDISSRNTGDHQCGEQPEPTVEAAAALAGWVRWSGGENPVPGKLVEILTRDGQRVVQTANESIWVHYPQRFSDFDIIAYRVIENSPAPSTDGEQG